MPEGWERIIAIVDAAAPVEVPVIARSSARDKSAPRQRRSALSAARPENSQAPIDGKPPDSGGPRSARAVAAGRGNVVDLRPTSQKGGSADEQRPANGGQGGAPPHGTVEPGDDGDFDDIDLRLAFFPQTDLGNAERFVERNRGKLLWCPALGWLWWDGKRWSRDGTDEKVKVAEHETVRGVQREGDALAKSGRDFWVPKGKDQILMSDKLRGWGRASEQANRLSPIAKRAGPYLAVTPNELDADPFKFNVANGTLVFRKAPGEDYITFKPHDADDRITKCSSVIYDPDAECPQFDAFFADVQPDEAQRRFLLQWQGLSLTGDIKEQKLFIFWGGGRNGKSTFCDVCAFIAGDYAATIPIETFLNDGRSRSAGQATPDLAMLPGVRMLQTSEPNRGAKLDEALIKLSTGGERITARHLNKEFFSFLPQFKLTISGQHRPDIRGGDEGIWRRPKLIPWTVTIPIDKVDRDLGDKLRAQASGVLNRLLDGLRDWMDNGLIESEAVKKATADYRSDSDPLGRFLEACVETASGERVQSSAMHELFNAWAKANGAAEWSAKGLTGALKERGYHSKHSNVMWWLDVKLTKSVNEYVDHEGKPLRESRKSQGGGTDDEVHW